MRKILFLYNLYEREHVIIERISEELQKKNNIKVFQRSCTDKDVQQQLLQIKPHVVVTYPITTYSQIDIYMFAKICCHSMIVTFTTEGVVDYHDKEFIRQCAGAYDYPSALVDYHVFWGRALARYLGKELYIQNKIFSKSQIRVVGNPMYEKRDSYGSSVTKELMRDGRSKVLVLTGFDAAFYTKQDIINAQDVVDVLKKSKEEILRDKVFIEYVDARENERIYCEKYIAHIVNAAKKHKEILFIVKLHPHEIASVKTGQKKMKYLEPLRRIENVRLIEKSIPVSELLPLCELMVHYGSTTDLESYLYKVPTLKLEQRGNVNRYMLASRRLTASSYYENIDDNDVLDKYLVKIENGEELFRQNKKIEKQLYAYMNYVIDKPYHPSKEMADFLSGRLKFHKLNIGLRERMHFIAEAFRIYFSSAIKS